MEDGKTVYRATVSQVLTGWGLPVMVTEGTAKAISDRIVVVCKGSCTEDLTLWRPSREEALASAADEIERLIAPAIAQVAKLRGMIVP
jgi:hypothetical protein